VVVSVTSQDNLVLSLILVLSCCLEPKDMDRVAKIAYNNVFKRTSTFIAAGIFAAFFFERGVDVLSNAIWENQNHGVRSMTRKEKSSNQIFY